MVPKCYTSYTSYTSTELHIVSSIKFLLTAMPFICVRNDIRILRRAHSLNIVLRVIHVMQVIHVMRVMHVDNR